MPRTSKKTKFVRHLSKVLENRLVARAYRTIDDDEDSIEDDIDIMTMSVIESASEQRYLFRNKYKSGRLKSVVFTDDLQQLQFDSAHQDDAGSANRSMPDEVPWLTDSELLQKYRIIRPSFEKIRQKIENHDVFLNRTSQRRKQAPVSHQLMLFLKFLGTEGSGGSNANQRNTFEVGYGSVNTYRKRVMKAIFL
jgi:hypothetical protein